MYQQSVRWILTSNISQAFLQQPLSQIRWYITDICGWESSVKYTVTFRNEKQTVHTLGVASVDVAYYGPKATI